jgi:hypothetical protein
LGYLFAFNDILGFWFIGSLLKSQPVLTSC